MSDDIVIEVPQDGKEHGLIGKISFALRVFCEAKGLGLGVINRVTVTHYQQREKPPLEKRDRAIKDGAPRQWKTEACPYCTRIPGWVVGAVKVDDKGRCVRCGHTVSELYTPSAERDAAVKAAYTPESTIRFEKQDSGFTPMLINCLIEPRDGDTSLFSVTADGKRIEASLKGYAIVPLEKYNKLKAKEVNDET